MRALLEVVRRHRAGEAVGICSVCSAHPLVLRAALQHAHATGGQALIEATSNQVNQEGGYTGLRPAGFRDVVCRIADEIGLPRERLLLGGDHLGPNCWQSLPAADALQRAAAMITEYVRAGFRKIHLDCSMSCSDDPRRLPDALIAERTATLCAQAEQTWERAGGERPVYVIGSEVPVPGGAQEALHELAVTEPQAALASIEAHHAAFARRGLDAVWERVIALVVQPGVEFDQDAVVEYDSAKAQRLSACLEVAPRFVFEAHSTDYQPAGMLAALVDDGFAILKVGPGLTFALREALYGLDAIAVELAAIRPEESLERTMERVMLDNPAHWRSHYPGSPEEQRLLRHFSYSDRIRYYWPDSRAAAAVERLIDRLGASAIPETLISQHLTRLHSSVLAGEIPPKPRELCLAAVNMALDPYYAATRGAPSSAASPP